MVASGAGGGVETEYELARRRNVERNAQRMAELGVRGALTFGAAPKKRKSTAARASKQKKPRAEPTRRSGRLANMPTLSYAEMDAMLPDEDGRGEWSRARAPARVADTSWSADPALEGAGSAPPHAAATEPERGPAPAPGSCRAMKASIDVDAWLGRQIPPAKGTAAMKDAVMRLLAGGAVRFNKYSGVQEWTNVDALFVNVDGGWKNYDNNFDFYAGAEEGAGDADKAKEIEGGNSGEAGAKHVGAVERTRCRMTWFAGSKVKEDSALVRRLLASGERSDGSGGSDDGYAAPAPLLFCRLPGEPYHFLGRVRCHRYWPGSSPVKLLWELTDAPALCAAPTFARFLAEVRPQ